MYKITMSVKIRWRCSLRDEKYMKIPYVITATASPQLGHLFSDVR
jgi:hypothetical protein